ncbi:hypothetical protein QAD02_003486 [Eretmocerus hayati]|uniref:Uncharacterized protein n=1 Tax=Eretmocerus hayati TaxID=131215 RepID=A0ACC2NM83_9HYME|nr:hypothetical protein QAD02_003486 [Eretmocerus hayati]
MDHILKEVNALELQVKSIGTVPSRKELEYVYPNEMLKQQLLDLDEINVSDDTRAIRRKRRLISKVGKIIELLDAKVPPLGQEPNEASQSESEREQRDKRLQLQAQQVEKILEFLDSQEFDDAEEVDTEAIDEGKANGVTPVESAPNKSCETTTPETIKKSKAVWHNDFRYKFDKISTAGTWYKDAAKYYPIQKVERSMHRWRAEVRKKGSGKVRNVEDYVKFFETPQGQSLLEYDPDNKRKLSYKIITEVVATKNGEKIFKHLALYDKDTLEEHEDCTVLQDDGTFLSRPKINGITQLFTIMARNYDKCFPCVWFLMSSRTAHAYQSCLKSMKNEIWPKLKPKEVIADFEEAMEIAWGNIYPEAKLTGCYFHFTQAILRNAIAKGAATRRNLKDNPQRHLIIRMVMALALLPSDTIVKTYEAIKKLAQKKFGTYFNAFFTYFEEYWIKRRGVERFCVYGKLDRTNNEQESMHRVLNFLFKHRRPHPWQFIEFHLDVVQGEVQGDADANEKDCNDEVDVVGRRIDFSDIEELLNFDDEDFCKECGQEDDGMAITGPCRIPVDELAEEDIQHNEILNQVRCYQKNSACSVIQRISDTSGRVDSDKSIAECEGEKTTERKKRPVPVHEPVHLASPENVEDIPTKRKRKSVMDGKYIEYDCR